MSAISLRMDEQEEKLIKEYAKGKNMTVSELVHSAVLEQIENDIDLKVYNQAKEEHETNPEDISFDEMLKDLDDPS
jgi:RHH-type transcriptional regulator, rel operon repressor / antitoxin RelB